MARLRRKWASAVCSAVLALTGCSAGGGQAGTTATRGPASGQWSPAPDAPAPAAHGPSRARLRAYAAAVTRKVHASMSSFHGVYSRVLVRPDYPSGIEYVYVLAHPVDPAVLAHRMRSATPGLRTTFDTVVGPQMRRELGLAHPRLTYTLRDPDGTVVWTRTFR